MEQIHKDALRRSRVALVNDLSVDNIADHLQTEEIFTPLMMEYIMGERTRIDKVRKLLDDLPRRGPEAYKKFLICLRDCSYGFLADKIEANEYAIRREKGLISTHVQQPVNNDESSAMHISSSYMPLTSSSFSSSSGDRNFSSSSQPITTQSFGHMTSPSETSSGSEIERRETSENTQGACAKKPRTCKNPDDDSLDLLVEGMEFEDEIDSADKIDSATERALLSDQGQTTVIQNTNQGQTTLTPPGSVISQPRESTGAHTGSISSVASNRSNYELNKGKSYKMDSNPRGLALIINNRHFDNMTERLGTEKDAEALTRMFYELKCGVREEKDITLRVMKRCLQEFASHKDLPDVDCIFVVLLSHGKDNEGVYGKDGQEIGVQEIFEMFSAQNCPAMINKPKMFIINACRGEKDGHSIPLPCRDGITQKDHVEREVNPIGRSVAMSLPEYRVVNHQDMIAAYSTFPGHVAYRNTEEGSWFIQDLVNVFMENWQVEHVNDLLTEVNNRVTKRRDEDFAQVPFPASSLTKKWFLNPPNPPTI